MEFQLNKSSSRLFAKCVLLLNKLAADLTLQVNPAECSLTLYATNGGHDDSSGSTLIRVFFCETFFESAGISDPVFAQHLKEMEQNDPVGFRKTSYRCSMRSKPLVRFILGMKREVRDRCDGLALILQVDRIAFEWIGAGVSTSRANATARAGDQQLQHVSSASAAGMKHPAQLLLDQSGGQGLGGSFVQQSHNSSFGGFGNPQNQQLQSIPENGGGGSGAGTTGGFRQQQVPVPPGEEMNAPAEEYVPCAKFTRQFELIETMKSVEGEVNPALEQIQQRQGQKVTIDVAGGGGGAGAPELQRGPHAVAGIGGAGASSSSSNVSVNAINGAAQNQNNYNQHQQSEVTDARFRLGMRVQMLSNILHEFNGAKELRICPHTAGREIVFRNHHIPPTASAAAPGVGGQQPPVGVGQQESFESVPIPAGGLAGVGVAGGGTQSGGHNNQQQEEEDDVEEQELARGDFKRMLDFPETDFYDAQLLDQQIVGHHANFLPGKHDLAFAPKTLVDFVKFLTFEVGGVEGSGRGGNAHGTGTAPSANPEGGRGHPPPASVQQIMGTQYNPTTGRPRDLVEVRFTEPGEVIEFTSSGIEQVQFSLFQSTEEFNGMSTHTWTQCKGRLAQMYAASTSGINQHGIRVKVEQDERQPPAFPPAVGLSQLAHPQVVRGQHMNQKQVQQQQQPPAGAHQGIDPSSSSSGNNIIASPNIPIPGTAAARSSPREQPSSKRRKRGQEASPGVVEQGNLFEAFPGEQVLAGPGGSASAAPLPGVVHNKNMAGAAGAPASDVVPVNANVPAIPSCQQLHPHSQKMQTRKSVGDQAEMAVEQVADDPDVLMSPNMGERAPHASAHVDQNQHDPAHPAPAAAAAKGVGAPGPVLPSRGSLAGTDVHWPATQTLFSPANIEGVSQAVHQVVPSAVIPPAGVSVSQVGGAAPAPLGMPPGAASSSSAAPVIVPGVPNPFGLDSMSQQQSLQGQQQQQQSLQHQQAFQGQPLLAPQNRGQPQNQNVFQQQQHFHAQQGVMGGVQQHHLHVPHFETGGGGAAAELGMQQHQPQHSGIVGGFQREQQSSSSSSAAFFPQEHQVQQQQQQQQPQSSNMSQQQQAVARPAPPQLLQQEQQNPPHLPQHQVQLPQQLPHQQEEERDELKDFYRTLGDPNDARGELFDFLSQNGGFHSPNASDNADLASLSDQNAAMNLDSLDW
ncbi:unnamed protein product [Amoebophrya sp. A25]|nr:unnamed protein product [Amoebophrya sp. A25]|eukprot:GSA25T00004072001.1